MSPEEFRLLRDLLHEHCGIYIREEMGYLMERRLAPRLRARSLSSFSGYHRFLRSDPGRQAELDLAVEALATNETYFFREPNQLRAFSEELLPTLAEKRGRERRLRLWSAGCSTGEECYTLAILVLASGLFRGWDVRIVGTDISRRVLASAAAAEYPVSALRATSEELRRTQFRLVNGRFVPRDEVRALVSFVHENLLATGHRELGSPALATPGQPPGVSLNELDAIFCRNVMIYFDLAARRRVLTAFRGRLSPGGYLLLGHSESLINVTADFELVHLRNDLVYRRPTQESPPGEAW